MKNQQTRRNARRLDSRRNRVRSKYSGDGTVIKSVEADAKSLMNLITGGRR